MKCESPDGQCPEEALFNMATHDLCHSRNLCGACIQGALLGTVLAFQDGPAYCPGCQKKAEHLEDVLVVTMLAGMPMDEAWREFNEENP
ncbi:hypothetical protein BI081_gp182 [Mycobacterium phage Tonenili]|uniref:Uncharacterized protein n=1 Tax=Mycobacterium phage Tonenili TaxID=1891703 RepID=A0A1C9EHF1_9CAUD|nr:hypothetical protein BI081_gp182 [Mycobacterium phage Tonenili]AON96925.1 hypothetical protein SEA_TONENILI_205 [Mycobacterium phage Tonenili]